jgi:hypothetical protein
MLLSLTVAGAVQASHLFPEHLAAAAMIAPMRFWLLLLVFSLSAARAQVAVRDDYGNAVTLAPPG